MCIDIVEIWFWIANGRISSIFELSPGDMSIFSLLDDNLSNCSWIFTKLCVYIDNLEVWFRITNWKLLPIFDRVIFPLHVQTIT